MNSTPNQYAHLSPLKQAYLAIEMLRSQIQQKDNNSLKSSKQLKPPRDNSPPNEPIAIIGSSCRLPGGCNTIEQFWQMLQEGRDGISEIPEDRWDMPAFYDADPMAPGKTYAKAGGTLDLEVGRFDADFFGLADREVISMDPQQRLLLEVSWEALERAGQAPDKLVNSATGVFVGINTNDYSRLQFESGGRDMLDAYYFTGNTPSVAAGRLSFVLGLQGPSIALDTACSSSLVTVHMAVQSLRAGECDMALAGGVNLMLSPDPFVMLSRMQALSADGRCKTFDQSADGYGRGEGCGMIVLKRLSDARAAGDRILALVRGTAIEHDGPSSGLTVPNGLSQQSVIRRALDNAGVSPLDISYVEAHGTGTALGDPLELEALQAVLGRGRSADNPLLIGSVKPNIGHLEAAAGIAGLLKLTLSLAHREIPPHIHCDNPTSKVDWDNLSLSIAKTQMPWSVAAGARRLAGISAFGMSGTNAHLILEEAPAPLPVPEEADPQAIALSHHLLCLSAKTDQALSDLRDRYLELLQVDDSISLQNLCFTANTGRAHYPSRLAIVADSQASMIAQLRQAKIHHNALRSRPKLAFLFTGQGSQYTQMGWELYQTQPVFKAAIDRCHLLLEAHCDRPLRSLLFPTLNASDSSDAPNDIINQTVYAQPALFALEYALAQLWMAWGLKPTVVMGHSVGEYVAACIAGVFSLSDALMLIAERGRLMQQLPLGGGMSVIMADAQSIAPVLTTFNNENPKTQVSIAAYNGPRNTVISGPQAAVQEICNQAKALGFHNRPLTVSHGFHSDLMVPMLENFERVARQVCYSSPQMRLISNLTGQAVNPEHICTATYWCDHIKQAVQFASGIETLQNLKCDAHIEIGPHPVLTGMVRQCLPATESSSLWLGSLDRRKGNWQSLLDSLRQLYNQGLSVNWSAVHHGLTHQHQLLPTYPFQRQHHWFEKPSQTSVTAPIVTSSQQPQSTVPHSLVGERLTQLACPTFERTLAFDDYAWMQSYRVSDLGAVPGSLLLEMFISAAQTVLAVPHIAVEDLHLDRPLAVSPGSSIKLQVVLSPPDGEQTKGQIFMLPMHADEHDSTWQLLATATCLSKTSFSSPREQNIDLSSLQAGQLLQPGSFFEQLAACQIEWEEPWKMLEQLWIEHPSSSNPSLPESPLASLTAQMTLPELDGQFITHPLLLELSALLAMQSCKVEPREPGSAPWQMVSCEQFWSQPLDDPQVWIRVSLRGQDATEIRADVEIYDRHGNSKVQMQGLHLAPQPHQYQPYRNDLALNNWLYEVNWQEQPLKTKRNNEAGSWLLFCDRNGVGDALAENLTHAGHTAITVRPGEQLSVIEGGWEIPAQDPQAFHQLLSEVLSPDAPPCRGLIYLWNLDAQDSATAPRDIPDGETLVRDQAFYCGGALHLSQALAQANITSARLWIATQMAQPIQGKFLSVAQIPIWGMGRALATENPDLWGGTVDLPQTTPEQAAALLLAEVLTDSHETEIVRRGDRRWVARLARVQRQALVPSPAIRPDSSYLITGGLGALGLIVADWLVSEGAQHLALIGRRAPSPQAQNAIDRWTSAGVQVSLYQGDVARSPKVAQIIQAINQGPAPLRGVLHLAGLLDDGVLLQQTWQRFADVMSPKVAGAWNLHQHTATLELDYFVCFSSVAALLGSPGQSNYAAANAFMDGLAQLRRQQGLAATSISWSAWHQLGMAVGNAGEESWNRSGIGTIDPVTGMAILGRLLAAQQPHMGVVPINWSVLLSRFPLGQIPPLLSNLSLNVEVQSTGNSQILDSLAETPINQKRGVLSRYLFQEVAAVLGVDVNRITGEQIGFFDLGMDSLMAVDLRNRLQSTFACTLPPTLTFEYPNLAALTDYLSHDILNFPLVESSPSPGHPGASAEVSPEPTLAPIDDSLSKLELEAQLEAELEALLNIQVEI